MPHTILPRFVPASWTVTALVPGDRLLVGFAAVLFAVVAGFVESRGAVLAALLDDHLVLGGLEGFAVVPGFVGASGAGITDAGDGGLGGDCGGSNKKCDAENNSGHDAASLVIVAVGVSKGSSSR